MIWLISRDEMGCFVARNACVCNRDKGRWVCSLSGAKKWVVWGWVVFGCYRWEKVCCFAESFVVLFILFRGWFTLNGYI